MKAITIDSKLLDAKVAIQNALENQEILSRLVIFGYTKTRLNEGRALLEKADQLHRKQQTEYGEKLAATSEAEEALIKANGIYRPYIKVARVALKKNFRGWAVLGLADRRKQSHAGWLGQALNFYLKALENKDVVADLSRFGINKTKLQAGLKLVKAYETALRKQQTEKGEAQASTKERDIAFDELEDWLADFLAIARIAMSDQPQFMEILGVVEPS